MTTEALYVQTLLKTNRLGTGVGQRIPIDVWVPLFNATQTTWLKNSLPLRQDSVHREQLASLLTVDHTLKPYRQDDRVYRFKLPEELYQISGVQVEAKKDHCKKRLSSKATSVEWATINWNNPLQEPDFEWEETFHNRAGTDLLVYYKDFSINTISLSFYKTPKNIDLPGYEHLDGTPSREINSDLPDECLQEILQLTIPLFI